MPATIVEAEVIEDAVSAACRAPSLHNSQPWRWVLHAGLLTLFLDQSRVLGTDRFEREALISCGAALDHLRLTMTARGWQSDIDRFPDATNPNLLASIRFTPLASVTDRDRRLAEAIWTRRTDRLPFDGPSDWNAIAESVVSAAGTTGVRVDILSDDARPRLIDAAQLTESLRFYDKPYHDELHWWTAPFEASEGIPYSALVSADEGKRVGIDRVFPVTHQAERRSAVPEDAAMILLLSTDADNRANALASGEALSAVLLECTRHGLATCSVTHLTELHVTRDLIQSLVDHDGVPQVLVRVGVTPTTDQATPPTPRRVLSDVLHVTS